jgi:hypothetical protein
LHQNDLQVLHRLKQVFSPFNISYHSVKYLFTNLEMTEPMDSLDETIAKPQLPLADFVVPELLLGLATAPLLVGLVGTKALAEALREIGALSEEIFRGDRLPLLTFPSDPDPHPDQSKSG